MVDRVGSRFVDEDWPRRVARITAKREKIGRFAMRLDLSRLKPGQAIPTIRNPLLGINQS